MSTLGQCQEWGLGPKLGPTEGANIRMQSCDAGDGSDANMNDNDVEGGDWHQSRVPTCNVASPSDAMEKSGSAESALMYQTVNLNISNIQVCKAGSSWLGTRLTH